MGIAFGVLAFVAAGFGLYFADGTPDDLRAVKFCGFACALFTAASVAVLIWAK